MIAFHGDKEIKAKYLARVRAHIKADEIIHGQYWEHGKGCAVGCTIHSSNHGAYETELGIPRILAKLEDGIFESLNNGCAKEWPNQFLSAIKVGADLSLVWPQFAVWMLIDPKWGVLQFATSDQLKKAIQDVADAYKGAAERSTAAVDWRKLCAAAYTDAYADASADASAVAAAAAAADASAYADAYTDAYADASADASAVAAAAAAADAAAYATAAADAYAATYAAADAAAYATAAADAYAATYAAADAAAYATAAADARTKWRIAQADRLLELLKAAPPPNTEGVE